MFRGKDIIPFGKASGWWTKWYFWAGLVVAATALVLYAFFSPDNNPYYPKCMFYTVTGWKCPGCGSQRMLHYLLTGHVTEAFKSNALLFLSLPYLGSLFWLEYMGGKERFPRLRALLMGRTACITAFVVIVLWWIARNMFSV